MVSKTFTDNITKVDADWANDVDALIYDVFGAPTTDAEARTNLGVNIGTDVQAWDTQLDDIAALALTDSNFIVGDGSNWVAESGATARTSLGLGTIATQAANSVDIDGGTVDGVTIGATAAPTVTDLGSVATCDINGGTIDGAVIGGAAPAAITGTTISDADGNIRTGGKNVVINGGMRVAQRGTSFTSATAPLNSDDTYLLDRWILLSDGNDIVDVTQQSSGGVSGNEDYIRLDVETVSKKFGILQVIENINLYGIIGDTVSLSLEAKVSDAAKLSDIRAVVLAWDSTADSVTSDVISAWGAEGANPTLVANWTAENTAVDLGVTTSWVKYTIAGISVDTASAKNIAVLIYQNDVATNDTLGSLLEITNVQIEKGSVATDFERRPIGEELTLCHRYASVLEPNLANSPIANGFHFSTTESRGVILFPVEMRVAPTVVASAGSTFEATGASVITNFTTVTFLEANTRSTVIRLTGGSGGTAGHGVYIRDDDGNAKITFDSEL